MFLIIQNALIIVSNDVIPKINAGIHRHLVEGKSDNDEPVNGLSNFARKREFQYQVSGENESPLVTGAMSAYLLNYIHRLSLLVINYAIHCHTTVMGIMTGNFVHTYQTWKFITLCHIVEEIFETETKWMPYARRQFEINLLKSILWYLTTNSLTLVLKSPIDKKSDLVEIIA